MTAPSTLPKPGQKSRSGSIPNLIPNTLNLVSKSLTSRAAKRTCDFFVMMMYVCLHHTSTMLLDHISPRLRKIECFFKKPYAIDMKPERYNANEHVNWKNIVTKNFVGGLMWGLGSVIGATMVLSLLLGSLQRLDFIPAVADFILQIQSTLESKK